LKIIKLGYQLPACMHQALLLNFFELKYLWFIRKKIRLFHYFITFGSQDINAYCQTRATI